MAAAPRIRSGQGRIKSYFSFLSFIQIFCAECLYKLNRKHKKAANRKFFLDNLETLKGHGNEADVRGFCRNRFTSPLHYLSSRSEFGFKYAKIFVIEKRLSDSPSRGVGESANEFLKEISRRRRVADSPTRWVAHFSGFLVVCGEERVFPICRRARIHHDQTDRHSKGNSTLLSILLSFIYLTIFCFSLSHFSLAFFVNISSHNPFVYLCLVTLLSISPTLSPLSISVSSPFCLSHLPSALCLSLSRHPFVYLTYP